MSLSNSNPSQGEFRLAELLATLSQALDMTEGQPRGHSVRSCWIGTRVGEALKLETEEAFDLYYAILLKDLGCSTSAARICAHYVTDDLTFKRNLSKLDGSLTQVLRFIISHAGMNAGMTTKFRTIMKALRKGDNSSIEMVETRCQRGAEIARQMRFSERVAQTIIGLDEHWDGTGYPSRLSGDQIPRLSQIALLSQLVDVFYTGGTKVEALNAVVSRRGSWLSEEVVDAFLLAAEDPEFWAKLDNSDLIEEIYKFEPGQVQKNVDDEYLDDIAGAFAQVVDSKSPFTAGHSERVMMYTDLIAEKLDVDETHRRVLRRGALLHDIGKLGVSNIILDKPGKLTDEEFEAIKLHPVHSEKILSQTSIFSNIINVAVGHHERLDGSGYPNGLKGEEIDLDTRIVAVADIFDALTADRPYRGAMTTDKAMGILKGMVPNQIDASCLAALEEVIAEFEDLPHLTSDQVA